MTDDLLLDPVPEAEELPDDVKNDEIIDLEDDE